jgi:hypothetical protein
MSRFGMVPGWDGHCGVVGITGITHFPMSDLNNREVAEQLSRWLHDHGLDEGIPRE